MAIVAALASLSSATLSSTSTLSTSCSAMTMSQLSQQIDHSNYNDYADYDDYNDLSEAKIDAADENDAILADDDLATHTSKIITRENRPHKDSQYHYEEYKKNHELSNEYKIAMKLYGKDKESSQYKQAKIELNRSIRQMKYHFNHLNQTLREKIQRINTIK
jgi:hypothetical protein